jgi:acyl-CoA dehydrogenase
MSQPTLEQFQADALAFLEANAPRKEAEKKFVWGEGADKVAMFEEKDRQSEKLDVAEACAWRRKKFDAGFGYIFGSEQYGGRGLPVAYSRAYDALEAKYEIPSQSCFTIGLGMVAPTIVDHGSDIARDLYVRKLWRGEMIASQLFSEPGAQPLFMMACKSQGCTASRGGHAGTGVSAATSYQYWLVA